MIKAECMGEMTKVSGEGRLEDLMNEYHAIIVDTFKRNREDHDMVEILLEATMDAITEGLGDELERLHEEVCDGQSEDDNFEPSYEVRIDNLS